MTQAPPSAVNGADSLIDEGRRALREMRIDDAIAAFDAALETRPEAIAAHFGLYEALQVKGERTRALEHQRKGLVHQQLFIEKTAGVGAPTILMISVAGDWQANVPLEFLYSLMPIGVYKLFVDTIPVDAKQLPRYDVVFNAIAQSDEADPVLRSAEVWFRKLGVPVINDPARVRRLSRDGVARDYADLAGMLVPATRRVWRKSLTEDALVARMSAQSPITIRPVDSQAGQQLARLDDKAALAAYLDACGAEDFFVAPFVDYRSQDGFYRKYRVIFVDGKPYPYHLAISERWMVHYYNGLNAAQDWIRAEEARWLEDIGTAFDGPRATALEELARRVGLDYFGIDCGILPDGRIVLFEIDVAMIVHLGEPIEQYPYKHRSVPRIYQAVERLIRERASLKP